MGAFKNNYIYATLVLVAMGAATAVTTGISNPDARDASATGAKHYMGYGGPGYTGLGYGAQYGAPIYPYAGLSPGLVPPYYSGPYGESPWMNNGMYPSSGMGNGYYPPVGYYPQQQGYPSQLYPQPGYPSQGGYPPQGYPQPGYPGYPYAVYSSSAQPTQTAATA